MVLLLKYLLFTLYHYWTLWIIAPLYEGVHSIKSDPFTV